MNHHHRRDRLFLFLIVFFCYNNNNNNCCSAFLQGQGGRRQWQQFQQSSLMPATNQKSITMTQRPSCIRTTTGTTGSSTHLLVSYEQQQEKEGETMIAKDGDTIGISGSSDSIIRNDKDHHHQQQQQTEEEETPQQQQQQQQQVFPIDGEPPQQQQQQYDLDENDDDDEDDDGPISESNIVPPHNTADATAAAMMPTISTPPYRCIRGVSPRTGPLNEAVSKIADVSLERANELIEIGAVWAKLETLTEEDLLEVYNEAQEDTFNGKMSKANARALYADLDDNYNNYYYEDSDEDDDDEDDDLDAYIEKMEQIRFKRVLSPTFIQVGTDLRIYPNPRRFTDSAQKMKRDSLLPPDQQKLLLYEDTTFLVVDKPPMLPTQPDTSNYYECAPGCTQSYYGPFENIQGNRIARPYLCHRVDACVGGCVVMSKDKNGQKVFQKFQRERKLKKLYLTVTRNEVPLGMHIHWMWAPQNTRGKAGGPPCQLLSHRPPESRRKARNYWIRCVLQVAKCEPIRISDSDEVFYQSTIRLVTGRKHQVRAQLASLGCPIYKDTLYEPMSGITLDKLDSGDESDYYEEQMDVALSNCRVPTEPIGLQAHAILFAGGSISCKANPPWWQQATN